MSAREPADSVFQEPSLELLFEQRDLPRFELPSCLTSTYGGSLGFGRPRVVANLVASLDGVVGLPGAQESGQIVSQNSAADRFVMGLLRACADAVLVGAGTFRRARGHYWYPGVIDPSRAESYADARRALGLSAQPKLVLVSESGTFDVSEPALRDAIVVTTPLAATRLASELPSTARVLGLGAGRVRLAEVVRLLNDEGLNLILSEGGPSLVAELVSERMLDELFLTSSPILFGRTAGDGRRALVEGLDLGGVPLELLSCRRQGSHLFSRYRVSKTVPAPAG